MMLVNAHAIETASVGKFEFIQEFVIEPVGLFRVIQFRGHIDPHATILFLGSDTA
jgi:hypothetical protein